MKRLRTLAFPMILLRAACLMLSIAGGLLYAQQAPRRITNLDAATAVRLPGSQPGAVLRATDLGRVMSSTPLNAITLRFALTAAQRSDLNALLQSQQQQDSPNYHRWLTPEQFAARFGAAAEDVSAVTAWLTAQHFTVLSATPLRIRFTGTAQAAEAAFHTELHNYTLPAANGSNGKPRTFTANATEISLPASLAQATTGILHLNTLRPSPLYHRGKAQKMAPDYTSSSGNALVPDDVRTIYDMGSIYSAGYTGAGQKIAVVGQTTVDISDISEFNSLFGGHNTNLITTLVPDTGSGVESTEDEFESDLDLEYSGSMAKDATVLFFYAGSGGDAFDAISYAIDEDVAPTVSISYGSCELDYTNSDAISFESLFDQANAQGQTLISAAGDSGATGCDQGGFGAANDGFALQLPADAPEVTAIGGTEFNEGSGTYWNPSNGPNYGSALSYIPEMVWNDSATTVPALEGLAAGGGGRSILFSKPSWQVAAGVPADGARDVPDISLAASNEHDPYFVCGPPDENGDNCADGYVNTAGGTSFGAPIFAGITALIAQARGTSQGNINPQIYTTAAATPAAFHDITVGNNNSPCTSGSTDCPAGTTSIGYSATTGYDLASGLGSIDAFVFAKSFPGFGSATPLAGTTEKLTINPSTPTASNSLTLSVSIQSTASGTPTGSVQFFVDGAAQGGTVSLSSGVATLSSAALPAGTHLLAAQYSGDTTFAAVGGELSFVVSPLPVTSTVLTLLPVAPTTSSSVSVTAKVNSSSGGAPTGTVQYSLDGAAPGQPQILSAQTSNYTLGQLSAGQHTVQAAYSGDTNFSASSGFSTFTVASVMPSQISLAILPVVPSDAESVTATATLPAGTTGTVQFTVDNAAVGSAVPVSGGIAIGALGKLSAGPHTLGAAYSGDKVFGSSSTSIQVSVTSNTTTFTLSTTNVSINGSQSAISNVMLTSASTYAGTVVLTLTGGGPSDLCYTIGSNPTVQAGSSASSTIRFFTGNGCLTSNARYLSGTRLASDAGSRGQIVRLGCSVFGMLLFCGFAKRRGFRRMAMILCMLSGFTMLSGCSSSTQSTQTKPAGPFTLTLTGTDSVDSNNLVSTTFTLTE